MQAEYEHSLLDNEISTTFSFLTDFNDMTKPTKLVCTKCEDSDQPGHHVVIHLSESSRGLHDFVCVSYAKPCEIKVSIGLLKLLI